MGVCVSMCGEGKWKVKERGFIFLLTTNMLIRIKKRIN